MRACVRAQETEIHSSVWAVHGLVVVMTTSKGDTSACVTHKTYMRGNCDVPHVPQYTDPINKQIAAAIKAHKDIPLSEIFVTTKVIAQRLVAGCFGDLGRTQADGRCKAPQAGNAASISIGITVAPAVASGQPHTVA